MYDLQKASFWKRISAYIFDMILVGIVAVGVGFLLSIALDYDSYKIKNDEIMLKYADEYEIVYDISYTERGESVDVGYDKYLTMSKKEKADCTVSVLHPDTLASLSDEQKTEYERKGFPLVWDGEEYQKRYDDIDKELAGDAEFADNYLTIVNISLVIASVGILVAFLLLEFLVPVLLKNGQTLGKKIFSIAVMQITGVKLSNLSLFIRTLFGKYTIGTMIPALSVVLLFFGAGGTFPCVCILAVIAVQIMLLILTKNNSAIHDMMASTVVVDMQSQMIFESKEALNAYYDRLAKEKASNDD